MNKRRRLPSRGPGQRSVHDAEPIQLHTSTLQACYEEHVWPRIRESVRNPPTRRPDTSTTIHHEVEIGSVISSTPVAKAGGNNNGAATASGAPSSSLLSGFIRKLQTSERSALGHLMPTGLCHAAQSLVRLLQPQTTKQQARFCLDPVIVWEEFVSYRIQHVNTVYILSQRRRTKLNAITQVCSPTQTEWKCKYQVELHGMEQRVQVAREALFDDTCQDYQRHTLPPPHTGGGATSPRVSGGQGQTLLQSCISLGLVDMRTDDPHIVEQLSEGNRVLFVWPIPPSQTGRRWGIDIRLILDASDVCTPTRIMQCLRSGRGSNSISMEMLTRAIGATLCQWRVELEYNEIITSQDFCHGFSIFAVFVRMATRQVDDETFEVLLREAKAEEKDPSVTSHMYGHEQYAHYQISIRFLADFLNQCGSQKIIWITTASANDLMPEHSSFVRQHDDAPQCLTVPVKNSSDTVTVPYPKQPRPRDSTVAAQQTLHTGHALVTAKLDGVEAFLLGTVHGLLLIARCGWLVYTPWCVAPSVPTPFLLEGEFLPLERTMSCYDALLLPCGDATGLPYRRRLGHLERFLRMHSPAINAAVSSYTVHTKPFFDYSAFPTLAMVQCFRWIQRVQLPADGFVVICGMRTYWRQFALKIKFSPSVDFLLHPHPELPPDCFQLMLRDQRNGEAVYCGLERDNFPLVARAPAGERELYALRVIEVSPTRSLGGRWDLSIGPVRERNKEPNYLSNTALMLDAIETEQAPVVQRVFGQRVIGDTIKIVQRHKWNYVAASIHSTWKLLVTSFQCTQFAIVEVGGGNGGDLRKWLALARDYPLRCVHVIEPDGEAQAVYRGRLLGLQGTGQYTVLTNGPGEVTVTQRSSATVTTFRLHHCTLADWCPLEAPPPTTGVCIVFNFSLAQIVSSPEDFGRILRSFLRRPTDHIVGVLHSYSTEVESTRRWSNGLVWSAKSDRAASRFPPVKLTVHGTRLATDITEAMVDIGQLVREARECGFAMYAESLCAAVRRPVHWLLGSLYGFSAFHRAAVSATVIPPHGPVPVPIATAQAARDTAAATSYDHPSVVIVIVNSHLLAYRVPGVALLCYLGQIPRCGPVGTPVGEQHRVLLVVTGAGILWHVACTSDCEHSGMHHCLFTDIGVAVSCKPCQLRLDPVVV
jgi:hypothetical protein